MTDSKTLEAKVKEIVERKIKLPESWSATPCLILVLENGSKQAIPTEIIVPENQIMAADIYSQFKEGKALSIKAENIGSLKWPQYAFRGKLKIGDGLTYGIQFSSFADGREGKLFSELWPWFKRGPYTWAIVNYLCLSQANPPQ